MSDRTARILLVDDEPQLLRLMQVYIEKLGYVVEACGNAASAQAAFTGNPEQFDLLIADVRLPDGSGQEMAIRMALGATATTVRRMVAGEASRLAGVGVVLGVGAALVLTRVMVSLVFGVQTYDPAVFAGVALLLSVIALLAALIPAHRASRIDPIAALRTE